MASFARHHFWLIARCAIYAWSFATAAIESSQMDPSVLTPTEPLSAGFVAILTLVIGGFMGFTALLVSVFVSLASLGFGVPAALLWVRPTHATNPFSFFGPPLGFFHFAGFVTIAAGLGLLVGAVFSGILAVLAGALFVAFGGAILVGLYFGMACCKNKFQDAHELPPPQKPRTEP